MDVACALASCKEMACGLGPSPTTSVLCALLQRRKSILTGMAPDEEEEEETTPPPKKNRKLMQVKEEVCVEGMCLHGPVMSCCITSCFAG